MTGISTLYSNVMFFRPKTYRLRSRTYSHTPPTKQKRMDLRTSPILRHMNLSLTHHRRLPSQPQLLPRLIHLNPHISSPTARRPRFQTRLAKLPGPVRRKQAVGRPADVILRYLCTRCKHTVFVVVPGAAGAWYPRSDDVHGEGCCFGL